MVFEALAAGAVPIVVDFGGPGDIVHPEIGYKVPLTSEADVVAQIERVLATLAVDRTLLNRLRRQGMSYARERLSWDGKARIVTQVLEWAVGHGPKPTLRPAQDAARAMPLARLVQK